MVIVGKLKKKCEQPTLNKNGEINPNDVVVVENDCEEYPPTTVSSTVSTTEYPPTNVSATVSTTVSNTTSKVLSDAEDDLKNPKEEGLIYKLRLKY